MVELVKELELAKYLNSVPAELRPLAEQQIALVSVPNDLIWSPDAQYKTEAVRALVNTLDYQAHTNPVFQLMLQQEGVSREDLRGILGSGQFSDVIQAAPYVDLEIYKKTITGPDSEVDNPLPGLLRIFPEEYLHQVWHSSATGANPSIMPRTELGSMLMAATYLNAFERALQLSSLKGELADIAVIFSPPLDNPQVQEMLKHSQFGFIAEFARKTLGKEGHYGMVLAERGFDLDVQGIGELLKRADADGLGVLFGASPQGIYGTMGQLMQSSQGNLSFPNIPYFVSIDGGGGLEAPKGRGQFRQVELGNYVGLLRKIFPNAQVKDLLSVFATSELCYSPYAEYMLDAEGVMQKIFHSPGYAQVAVLDPNSGMIYPEGKGLLVVATAIGLDAAGANVAVTSDVVDVYQGHPITGETGTFWIYRGRASDLLPDLFTDRKSGCGMNYLQMAEKLESKV